MLDARETIVFTVSTQIPACVIHSQDKINTLKIRMWTLQSPSVNSEYSQLPPDRWSWSLPYWLDTLIMTGTTHIIPLRRVMGNYANVFKLDRKANLKGPSHPQCFVRLKFVIRHFLCTRKSRVIGNPFPSDLFKTQNSFICPQIVIYLFHLWFITLFYSLFVLGTKNSFYKVTAQPANGQKRSNG